MNLDGPRLARGHGAAAGGEALGTEAWSPVTFCARILTEETEIWLTVLHRKACEQGFYRMFLLGIQVLSGTHWLWRKESCWHQASEGRSIKAHDGGGGGKSPGPPLSVLQKPPPSPLHSREGNATNPASPLGNRQRASEEEGLTSS